MWGSALTRNSKIGLFLLCFTSLMILGVIQLRETVETTGIYKEIIMRMQISPANDPILEDVKQKCPAWFQWTKVYRKCVINYLDTKKQNGASSAWHFMHEAISTCSGQAMFDMLNVNFLHNHDDVKLVILPIAKNNNKISNINENCTEVTLGVGNDTESEKGLLKLIPGCQLHGADPFANVGQIFQEIGKYHEVAVAGKSGIFSADILVGPGIFDYARKDVPAIDFVEFLIEKIKNKNIDYLFMDNEGAEYEILPLFYRGGRVEKNNLNICQMSVELHGPLQNYNMTLARYDELLRNLTVNSGMLPLWSAAPQNHARMFWIDAESNYCVQKYLYNWCVV